MSKKKQRPVPARQMSKRQLSRWERDKKLQRMTYIVAAALGLVLVAVLGVGVFREVVQPPRETVAQVNDRSFTMDYYVKLYSLRDYILTIQQSFLQQSQAATPGSNPNNMQQQLQQIQFARAMLPEQVVEEIIDDELIRQGAQAQGITATSQEVDDYLMTQFVAPPKEGEEVDPEKQRSDFQQAYNNVLTATGISDAQYRELATAEVLRKKIDQQLQDALPTKAEQVHVQTIQATTQDEADAVKAKLAEGVPFDQIAQQLTKTTAPDASPSPSGDPSANPSADPAPVSPPVQTGPSFNDPGWLPRGVLNAEFDDAAFALQPGQVSDAVTLPSGFAFIKVIERQDDREISSDQQQQLKGRVFQTWLDNQQKTARIERKLDSQKQSWATRQVQKMRGKIGRAGA